MQVLFGRRKPKKEQNFAEEMLDLEVEVDMKCTLPKVKKLMELYSRTIEFYASKQDPKYLHYQERLQHLLARSDVLDLLEGKTPTKPKKTKRPLSTRRPANLSHERSAEKTMNSHLVNNSQVAKKLQANIRGQHSTLINRLIQRKMSRNNLNESDRSGGSPKATFEDKIEAVIEMYVNEKFLAKERLQEKYLEKKNMIENSDDPELKSSGIEKIDQKFDEELNFTYQKIEEEKQLRLQDLRRTFS